MTRLLIGSVMEGVLRDAHRDILIIPVDQDDNVAAPTPPSQAWDTQGGSLGARVVDGPSPNASDGE